MKVIKLNSQEYEALREVGEKIVSDNSKFIGFLKIICVLHNPTRPLLYITPIILTNLLNSEKERYTHYRRWDDPDIPQGKLIAKNEILLLKDAAIKTN